MKHHLLLGNVIFSIFFFCTHAAAQSDKDSLDRELDSLFTRLKLPGMSAVIVSSEKILYEKNLGFADIQAKKPFGRYTVENIGSVSKTFIAVALMKAIELGYFTLETDINDILPFRVINPHTSGLPIKIKNLAAHTSGIVDNDSIYHRSYLFQNDSSIDQSVWQFINENGYTGGIPDTSLKDFMYSYLSSNGRLYSEKNFFKSDPGSRSSYSNIGSALIAYLIQIKAGVSFADFTKKYILRPLKMEQSSWFLDDQKKRNYAVPYVDSSRKLPYYSLITYPDGGLRTSVGDLIKYARAMMRGLNHRPALLTGNSFTTMFTGMFSASNLPQSFSLQTRNKGVLWNIYNDGFIGHDGDDPGVSTNLFFNKNVAIIFLTNIYLEDRSPFLNALKKYAVELAVGKR